MQIELPLVGGAADGETFAFECDFQNRPLQRIVTIPIYPKPVPIRRLSSKHDPCPAVVLHGTAETYELEELRVDRGDGRAPSLYFYREASIPSWEAFNMLINGYSK